MGHLAFVGSHKVNGVSALHTELMRETVFRDLHALYPDRIVNKTNGITFRRWLLQANPGLTRAARRGARRRRCSTISSSSRRSSRSPTTPAFRERFAAVKRANKSALASAHRRADRRQARSRPRCSTSRSSAFTSTSASCSTFSRRRALPGDPRRAGPQLGAAGQDLRRQGGRELSPGQADHQADQRRRAGGQPRPASATG